MWSQEQCGGLPHKRRRWVVRVFSVVTAVTASVIVLAGPTYAANAGAKARARAPLANLVTAVGSVVAGLGTPDGGARTTTTTTTTVTVKVSAPKPSNQDRSGTEPVTGPAMSARIEPADPRCRAALADVEATGLVLPAVFEYRCPGSTELFAGARQHWGTTCAQTSLCPNGAYVAINPAVIGPSESRLRYVVAHEICHARGYIAHRPVDEAAADSCAAAHGFPRA